MKNFLLILCLLLLVFFPGCLKSGPSVKDLQEQIVKIEKEKQELKSQVDKVKKENGQLKSQSEKTRKENNQLKIQANKIKKENNHLKSQTEKIKKERDNALNKLKELAGKDFNSQSIPSESDDLIQNVNNIKDDVLKGVSY
jgi:chromosome segregation ATPase